MIRPALFLPALALVTLSTPGSAQRPATTPGTAQRPAAATTTFTPRFEAVADTRLLMEGMVHSNYRSLGKLLKNKPTDRETWVFARGQAILVAESGNLLLLRPPRGAGRDPWMKQAMEMRSQAVTLATVVAAKDHAKSLRALADLKGACVRCHQTFRVDVKLDAEPVPGETDAE
jgi:hypothetical protein